MLASRGHADDEDTAAVRAVDRGHRALVERHRAFVQRRQSDRSLS
jgi:hypothetical protein